MSDNSKHSAEVKKPRRVSGIVLFCLLFLAIAAITYRPSVETIVCDDAILETKPDVIMLGAWWCPYCYQARKYLQYNNINYCEYDMERSDEGRKMYHDINGQTIPVLLIGDYRISGFNERSIKKALEVLHSK